MTVYKSRSHHDHRILTTRTRRYFPCFPRKRTKSHVSLTCSKAADTISSTALNHLTALFGLNGTEVLHMKFAQCIIFFDAPLTPATLFTISSRHPSCACTYILPHEISACSCKMRARENRIYFKWEWKSLQLNPMSINAINFRKWIMSKLHTYTICTKCLIQIGI